MRKNYFFYQRPFQGLLTLVLAGGQGERLYPLTRERAKPACPFAGSFRLIDFTLSNCVNSGIRRIYVLTQYMSTTLETHIKEGWSIFSRELGEFIQTVPPQKRTAERWYEGTADAVFQNLYILQEEKPLYVLILSGDHVYRMNYADMFRFHVEKKAHLTVGCVEVDEKEAGRFGVLEIDRRERVISFEEKPSIPKTIPGKKERCLVSMGVYIFNTEEIVKALIKDAKRKNTSHDFGRDIIPQMLKDKKLVFCYNFSERGEGYWRDIGTIDSYWEASMELLDVPSKFDLHRPDWPLRTYQEQNPPARIITSEKVSSECGVSDSLICAGCIIEQAKVKKSILSPQVYVGRKSTVENSILMKGVRVGENVTIKKAIIDEEVVVPDGYRIGCNFEEDAKKFLISKGGVVVV
ncbi:glucose-1-phosphate adenylyltransferase, partial [Candidatus Aerophobetes bacterium]|nr:glucose-1-phosphate adenylyltransferase [Candidatus Aerophobetes bacterium]